MAYESEIGYVQRKLNSGTRKFERSNPHISTLLRVAKSDKEVAKFVEDNNLRDCLY